MRSTSTSTELRLWNLYVAGISKRSCAMTVNSTPHCSAFFSKCCGGGGRNEHTMGVLTEVDRSSQQRHLMSDKRAARGDVRSLEECKGQRWVLPSIHKHNRPKQTTDRLSHPNFPKSKSPQTKVMPLHALECGLDMNRGVSSYHSIRMGVSHPGTTSIFVKPPKSLGSIRVKWGDVSTLCRTFLVDVLCMEYTVGAAWNISMRETYAIKEGPRSRKGCGKPSVINEMQTRRGGKCSQPPH